MALLTPCFDCTERFVGCHSKCDKYAEWQKNHQKRKDEVRKSKNEISRVMEFKVDQVTKTKKRVNRK